MQENNDVYKQQLYKAVNRCSHPLIHLLAAFQAKLFEVSFLSRLRDCKEAQGTAQSKELCLPTGAISDSALAFNASELEAAQITESHPIGVPKSLCTDAVGVLEDLSGAVRPFPNNPLEQSGGSVTSSSYFLIPIGQEIPVPPRPQYPSGFLLRYC